MAQRDKLIEQIKSARMIDFDDAHKLLTQLGFKCRISGSHHIYTNDPYVIGLVRHGKQLKRAYLQDIKDLLTLMGV